MGALLHARVLSWGFWESCNDDAVLCAKTPDTQSLHMRHNILESVVKPALRRRLDLYGRVAGQVLATVLTDVKNPFVVFASRHGNIDRTLKLLHQLAIGDQLSPIDFSMSVHNALVGIISINWSITQSHTAISAGRDSFVAGLTETLCQLLVQRQPVLFCFVDLPLPDVYRDNDPSDITGVALAICLDPSGISEQSTSNIFSFFPVSTRSNNGIPHRQIHDFVRFLAHPTTISVELFGKTAGWSIARHA